MNGYKIVLLKAILCFIGCRKVNGYAPEYVFWGVSNYNFTLDLLLIVPYIYLNKTLLLEQIKQ